ncbi:hypothetical protein WKW77_06835 [Variovorax ureilyticus]|uniref:Uncharacterized protein n=1 Tax=Variovorax ureilyticus TaxID=1836198 RepID=A0ABU8VAU5_9BURK
MPLPVEAIGMPAGPRHAPTAEAARTPPGAPEVPRAEAEGVRAASRLDAVVPKPESAEAPQLHSPAFRGAMPAAVPASAEALPKAADKAVAPAVEDRISPWRAPVEPRAEPAIQTRTAPQVPLSTPTPRQRDKPEAAVDDSPSVVQVTIGRLEVRAPEAPRQPPPKPKRAAPRLSLQDYLQRRTEGRAR